MSSSNSRSYRDSVTGTGAALNVTKVGFRPKRVRLFNVGAGLCEGYWQDTMPDASMVKRVTAGTMSFPLTNGITPLANGFTIGADANLNVAGQVIHFEATD